MAHDKLTVELAARDIERYADKLGELIQPLSQTQLWYKDEGMPNAVGTLVRHLTGNLNHYFGAGFLANGYARDREREFTETGLTVAQLQAELAAAVVVMRAGIAAIDPAQVMQPYTAPGGEQYDLLAYHVVRLATHFVFHVGQVDYAVNRLWG